MFRFFVLLIFPLIFLVGCVNSQQTVGIDHLRPMTSRREAMVQHFDPGQKVDIGTMEGPGVIRHLWFTAQCNDPKLYGKMVMRVWWDGEDSPSIETPLGDFFGVGFGEERSVRSAAVEMIPAGLPGHAALNCWLPMPFEAARVEIENQSEEEAVLFYIIQWEQVDQLDKDQGRLHAHWARSNPVERGVHHTVMKAEGDGQYMGLVYSIRRLEGGAWVEGGEDYYIDIREDEWEALEQNDCTLVAPDRQVAEDARSIANQPLGPVQPTIPGIGGEDYFCMSWGYRPEDKSLYHGVSLGPEDEEKRMTAYRFHLLDPVRFTKNLYLKFRNHGWDVQARSDDVTTLAYWYQKEPHLEQEPLPPVAERLDP